MLTDEELKIVENATVFYPEIKVNGKVIDGLCMTKTLLANGHMVSCTFNRVTKRMAMLLRKAGFEGGVYRQRKQCPGSVERFMCIGTVLAGEMRIQWNTIAVRVYLAARNDGSSVFCPENVRGIYDEKRYAKYLYDESVFLLHFYKTEERPEFQRHQESTKAAEESARQSAKPARYVAYMLYNFRTGEMTRADALECEGGWVTADLRKFGRDSYIARPVEH